MKIIRKIEDIKKTISPPFPACITIGNFDGIHKGHQQLFARVVKRAKEQKGTSIAITFDPHPLQVLRQKDTPPVKFITNKAQKEEYIREAGVDFLIIIPFSREFAKRDAEDFLSDILIKKLSVQTLIVGYDYAFGKGRSGNIEFLQERGRETGFTVEVIPPFYVQGEIVSSTRIRKLLLSGKMEEAAACLGRPYQIRGRVRHGKKRGGAELGFPTANLHFHDNDVVPKEGVYAVEVEYNEKSYGGVLNIGKNPTFDGDNLVAETHIFGFNKDIYDREITLSLHKYLRGEVKFSSIDALIAQIKDDSRQAKELLAAIQQR